MDNTCAAVRDRLYELLDASDVSDPELMRLADHLASCRECQRERDELRGFLRTSDEALNLISPALDADLRARAEFGVRRLRRLILADATVAAPGSTLLERIASLNNVIRFPPLNIPRLSALAAAPATQQTSPDPQHLLQVLDAETGTLAEVLHGLAETQVFVSLPDGSLDGKTLYLTVQGGGRHHTLATEVRDGVGTWRLPAVEIAEGACSLAVTVEKPVDGEPRDAVGS